MCKLKTIAAFNEECRSTKLKVQSIDGAKQFFLIPRLIFPED